MNNWILINLFSWSIMTLIIISIIIKTMHPVMMILLMLMYTSLLCFNMSLWNMNFIFPIMLFMMMISGLLIIFLYFSSIISNKKSMKYYFMNPNSFFIMGLTFIPWLIYKMISPSPLTNLDLSSFLANSSFSDFIINSKPTEPLFAPPISNMTLICISVLMLTMIMVIKICSPKSKSLRKLT